MIESSSLSAEIYPISLSPATRLFAYHLEPTCPLRGLAPRNLWGYHVIESF